MTSAAEMFVISLARASKRARKHLHGLDKADRDDVLATAILWCWENKATYKPAVSLDDWFVGAIRNARKAFERGEAKQPAEVAEVIAAPDDPSWHVEIQQAIERMTATMDERDRGIILLSMQGLEHVDIAQTLGVSLPTVARRMARMRSYIPEKENFKLAMRRAQSAGSDETSEPAPIDKEIAKLEFLPPAGADCPPCWRCKWFDGYLPGAHRPTKMKIMEPEIRAAVLDVEARKIEIAQGQRRG